MFGCIIPYPFWKKTNASGTNILLFKEHLVSGSVSLGTLNNSLQKIQASIQ